MKIVLPGGTGQVGTLLARHFAKEGHDVVVLSRRPVPENRWCVAAWDGRSAGAWTREIDGADVVINLAGRSVNCRYYPANRRAMMDSRIDSTRAVSAAIAHAAQPPPLWLQMSTATIYAHRFDAPNDEFTGLLGGSEPNAPDTWRFSIDLATAWEKAALADPLPCTRRVLMRAAMTMSPDPGGIFATLLGLVRKGLGGQASDGRQFISWIHEIDFIRAVEWLIAHENLSGPVNLASPGPLPNKDFMRILRRAWGTRLGLPAARWMLELGALVLRTETELILKSRRVVPALLQREGFTFQFPDWTAAAQELCGRAKANRS